MNEYVIYALGFFDGVHLGHQALLKACRDLAKETGCKAGVVTFTSHPDALISGKRPALINSPIDRKQLLAHHYSMDVVVELPFDEDLMKMNWRDFIRMMREKGGKGFVCGSDFRFGYQGEGTAQILEQYCKAAGLPCAIIPQQILDDVRVSSTHIRTLLENGDMAQAVRFLGHPHMLSGTVVSGRKLGRTLGIPTANIPLPEDVICPKQGVYICKALVDGKEYPAVTNIGNRPTVGGHHITVEPWLLDFAGDLYGKTLTLLFYEFIRPEKKFDSLEDLKAEIQKNAEKTRNFFHKT